jgi:hypothetical protein
LAGKNVANIEQQMSAECAGDDRVFNFHGAANRDRSAPAARPARVRHDYATLHYRDVQQLRHALAGGGHVRCFLGRFGLDGLGERSRLVARKDHGELLREFGFEGGQDFGTGETGAFEIAGAAQSRAKAAAFVPSGRDQVAGFDFHVHCRSESIRARRSFVAGF